LCFFVFLGGAFASPTQPAITTGSGLPLHTSTSRTTSTSRPTGSELNYYFLLGQQQPVRIKNDSLNVSFIRTLLSNKCLFQILKWKNKPWWTMKCVIANLDSFSCFSITNFFFLTKTNKKNLPFQCYGTRECSNHTCFVLWSNTSSDLGHGYAHKSGLNIKMPWHNRWIQERWIRVERLQVWKKHRHWFATPY